MNIMMVHLRNIGGGAGGLGKVLCQFSNAMITRGHRVALVIYDDTGEKPYYPLDKRVQLINIREWRSEPRRMKTLNKLSREWARTRGHVEEWYESYRDPYILPSLAKVYASFHPDVILNQYYASSGFVYASHPSCPVVNMIHGIPQRSFGSSSKRERQGYAHSAFVQVLLPGYVSYVKAWLPKTPCIWIPNAVPQVKDIVDLESHNDKYTIIQVGRLHKKIKRQYLLIEAFAKIAHKFPNWSVQFWGEGNEIYKKELEQLIIKYHLESQITLCGITHNIFRQYKKADIFAFPSASEGFPLALTEAMSVGLPAIAFRSCQACADLIRDKETGILTEDGADAFAQGLSKLMKDKELRIGLGYKAHEDMKPYAPEKIWDKWEQVLKKVVTGQTIY